MAFQQLCNLFVVLLLSLTQSSASSARASPPNSKPPTPATFLSSCIPAGFNPSQLSCSTCAHVARALGEAHASVGECRSCCSSVLDLLEGGFDAPRRTFDADAVTLRLCKAHPPGGLNEWLEKSEQAWAAKGVHVVDACGMEQPPVVQLDEVLSVPIAAWRHEDVSAFLTKSISGIGK